MIQVICFDAQLSNLSIAYYQQQILSIVNQLAVYDIVHVSKIGGWTSFIVTYIIVFSGTKESSAKKYKFQK